jgi:hypothetical protein
MVTVPLTVALPAGAVIFTSACEGSFCEIRRITTTPIAYAGLPALLAKPLPAIRMTHAPFFVHDRGVTRQDHADRTWNAPQKSIQESQEKETDGREN